MTVPSSTITIVGLGPGDPDLRTLGTQRALHAADAIILRTRVHPGIDDLLIDPRVSDCDDLYQSADHFDDLYSAIAKRVLDRALAGGNVVFAVPGHPRFAERSVGLIERAASEQGVLIHVLDAVSFVDTAAGAIGEDPVASGLQITDAEHLAATVDDEPFSAGRLGIDPARPLLVAQVYDEKLAAAVKLALTRIYPDNHRVTLLQGVGVAAENSLRQIALHELDRQEPDHSTCLWVPPLEPLGAFRAPETLTRIVARLRAPGGCPWDREQTPASMRNAVVEEAYETVDALDSEDNTGLAEELGDLLLLVTMQAQMAEEAGAFRIEDVYEGISRKLIRRHPHVFGTVEAETPDAVVATWEGVKAEERAAKGEAASKSSRFSRLPRSMPATRKVIELMAPHEQFSAPDNAHAGDNLLDTVMRLIEQRIDPELALEASLRQHVEPDSETQFVAAGPAADEGKGRE